MGRKEYTNNQRFREEERGHNTHGIMHHRIHEFNYCLFAAIIDIVINMLTQLDRFKCCFEPVTIKPFGLFVNLLNK